MYLEIYEALCNKNRIRREGLSLHEHHIIPRHSGGQDDESNYTYLTPREHQIAHFLLWKINRNPNDLRSMKMLGARLTKEQRRIIGLWCRDNDIGMHSAAYRSNKQANIERTKKSAATQKERGVGTFDPEYRKVIASRGGTIGGKSQKEAKIGIHDPANFKKNSSLGGKSIIGMICVTNGQHRTRIRPEKLEEYLTAGYVKGFTLSSDTES